MNGNLKNEFDFGQLTNEKLTHQNDRKHRNVHTRATSDENPS